MTQPTKEQKEIVLRVAKLTRQGKIQWGRPDDRGSRDSIVIKDDLDITREVGPFFALWKWPGDGRRDGGVSLFVYDTASYHSHLTRIDECPGSCRNLFRQIDNFWRQVDHFVEIGYIKSRSDDSEEETVLKKKITPAAIREMKRREAAEKVAKALTEKARKAKEREKEKKRLAEWKKKKAIEDRKEKSEEKKVLNSILTKIKI